MPKAEFWYEFASTYSYPAAMRVEALAAERGIDLAWRPFLLGPLFAEVGWRDSPFNLYPVKGRYMWRDMERICASLGLVFRRPDPFPQNSLLAARVAVSLDDEIRPKFSRRVYLAEFAEGRAISERAVIADVLNQLGLGAEAHLAAAENAANKQKLKAWVERAVAIGLFGAPTLVTEDGEIFWGNDRLEQGFDWAMGKR
jgi:2-hydroxychromene-2-carboxylate isomerase